MFCSLYVLTLGVSLLTPLPSQQFLAWPRHQEPKRLQVFAKQTISDSELGVVIIK